MAVWQFDLMFSPMQMGTVSTGSASKTFSLDDKSLRSRIKEILPQAASWSDEILIWGEENGDRIQAVVEDGRIVELAARIDLRKLNRRFVEELVQLAIDCNSSFETNDGSAVSPALRSIAEAIRRSESYRFVANPDTFFEK